MENSFLNSDIHIKDLSQFDPKQILTCGQVFRYYERENSFDIIGKNLICRLNYHSDHVIIHTNDTERAAAYFDLDTDYNSIKTRLTGIHPVLDEAIRFGHGIRILNQDPAEMIISFIISANNNIPRIKGIIERLCERLGENKNGFFAFPTTEALASADESFYKSIGAGYRAAYIVKTAKVLADGLIFERDTPTDRLRAQLMKLDGVGPKVADCILLFGLHRTDVFPVDIWTSRVYRSLGLGEESCRKRMAQKLVEKFGSLSGYAQQYLYYYYRENKLIFI